MLGRRMGRPGLIGLAARTAVVAGTANAVSNRMSERQQQRAEEQQELQAYEEQQARAQALAAAQPAQAPAADDVVSRLERLAALRQQGVLTDEEFAAQKARILAQ